MGCDITPVLGDESLAVTAFHLEIICKIRCFCHFVFICSINIYRVANYVQKHYAVWVAERTDMALAYRADNLIQDAAMFLTTTQCTQVTCHRTRADSMG